MVDGRVKEGTQNLVNRRGTLKLIMEIMVDESILLDNTFSRYFRIIKYLRPDNGYSPSFKKTWL